LISQTQEKAKLSSAGSISHPPFGDNGWDLPLSTGLLQFNSLILFFRIWGMKISRRHSTNIPDDQIRQRAVDLGKHRWAEDGVGRTVEFIENYISSSS